MTRYKVGYFVGSLAKASINRQLAKALIRLAPPELVFSEMSIKDLPLSRGPEVLPVVRDVSWGRPHATSSGYRSAP